MAASREAKITWLAQALGAAGDFVVNLFRTAEVTEAQRELHASVDLLAKAGLDDVTLALLKMRLLQRSGGTPLADQTALRLAAVAGEVLRFDGLALATEQPLEGLAVPRSWYRASLDDTDAWAEARAPIEGAPLVNGRRLVFEGAEA